MMKGKLKENEIRHLALHLEGFYEGPSLEECLRNGLSVPLSDKALREEEIFFIDEIPVLFPLSDKSQWYSKLEKGVEFHHDILKSAFYLLSGFQEQDPDLYDPNGRFSWEHSLQYRLGIGGKAVVNHYFEVLLDALEQCCRLTGRDFRRTGPPKPVLFLSHDIDRIRKYTLRNVVHTFLHIFRPGHQGMKAQRRIGIFRDHLRGFLLFRKDPYKNSLDLLDLEKGLGIRSTWFLLEKRGAHNSKYRFSDREIGTLTARIEEEGSEVGLHGTLESSGNAVLLGEERERLGKICRTEPLGCRQHFLRYRLPASARAQEEAGLVYDASLGFAEQTGFRNSYCHPFRSWDFEKEESRELWHLPLVAMDVSLLEYMGKEVGELESELAPLLEETIRFNGVFSLLWHNCRLDEEEYPGIGPVYRKILEGILEKGLEPRCGIEIVKKVK